MSGFFFLFLNGLCQNRGPNVIKLSRVRTRTLQIVLRAPNCTHTQEVEVIKRFRTRF